MKKKSMLDRLFTTNLQGCPNWALWLALAAILTTFLYIPTQGHGRLSGAQWGIIAVGGGMAIASGVYNLRKEK